MIIAENYFFRSVHKEILTKLLTVPLAVFPPMTAVSTELIWMTHCPLSPIAPGSWMLVSQGWISADVQSSCLKISVDAETVVTPPDISWPPVAHQRYFVGQLSFMPEVSGYCGLEALKKRKHNFDDEKESLMILIIILKRVGKHLELIHLLEILEIFW